MTDERRLVSREERRKADQPDCSKCGHASVLHNGPKLFCAAVFQGAWGPCTCSGYLAALPQPATEPVLDVEREIRLSLQTVR